MSVFDTGSSAATTTFAERGIGDVLITFEAEVRAAIKEFGDAKYDAVIPRSACWPNSRSRWWTRSPMPAAAGPWPRSI